MDPRNALSSTVFLGLLWGGSLLAEDFRIQTRVYRADEETPVSQNLTLFRGGVVYDFLSEPAETTIYDRPRGNKTGRFVLLNPEKQVQTEVPLEKLGRFTSNLQLMAASQGDPFLRFLAKPEFKEEVHSKEQACTYSSRWMNYRLKTAPAPMKGCSSNTTTSPSSSCG